MPWNPLETIDYIFNRYAYLGLPADASPEAIKAAIKTKRVANHPDRLTNAGPEVQATAQGILQRLADCEHMLLNPQRKAYFDARLAEFTQQRPRAICTDGTPLIVLDAQHFDVPVLLGQAEGTGRDEAVLAHARMLSGYNPDKTDTLRRLYMAAPTDAGVRAMLVEALRAEMLYLDALEEDAYQTVGIANKRNKVSEALNDPADYAEMAQLELGRLIDEDLSAQLGSTLGLARIGMAPAALLLAPPGADPATSKLPTRLDDVRVEDLVEVARGRLQQRQGELYQASLRKQAVLEELVNLSDLTWLTPQPGRVGDFTLMLMLGRKGEEPVAVMAVTGNDASPNAGSNDSHEGLGKTVAQLAAMSFPHDVLAITIDPELDHLFVGITPAINKRRVTLGLKPYGHAA
ncbi:MAG TPA: J domain-containing protein [Alphaproteobacteria bacterium]|nr:J domain-containing protein [Alphaproteobacteria bacterium]